MSEIAKKQTAETKLLKSAEKEKLEVDKVESKTPEKVKKLEEPASKDNSQIKENPLKK